MLDTVRSELDEEKRVREEQAKAEQEKEEKKAEKPGQRPARKKKRVDYSEFAERKDPLFQWRFMRALATENFPAFQV